MLLFCIIMVQYFFDESKSHELKPSPYVMSAEVVKAADLGLDNAASDLAWLSAIQYFGDWQLDKYEKLDDFITLANDLDPRFSHPYAFATLSLPQVGMVDEAIEIAKRGIREADTDWEIPYYLGMIYYIEKNDVASALKYFDRAANTKGAPEKIQRLAANFNTKPDSREQSKEIWATVYETTNDESIKARAEAYILHYEILDFLERAAKDYKDKYGNYPDPIGKLVEGGVLKAIPTDPFGFEFEIDAEGRVRIKN
jgi:tetratricopeptide (TPR) repeat protein